MRRQDVQLRLLAKQGDVEARLKLGEAYLAGNASVPRNIPVGLDYLRAALPQSPRQAAMCIAQHLQLHEILEQDQLEMLELAAEHGDLPRLKLATWKLIQGDRVAALALVGRCTSLPPGPLRAMAVDPNKPTPAALLQAIRAAQPVEVTLVVQHAATKALAAGRMGQTVQILEALADVPDTVPTAVHELIVEVLRRLEEQRLSLGGLPIALIETALDRCASTGHLYACHTLGRALAGIRCGELPPERLVAGAHLRKAAALLLRAADGGVPKAWLHLYRICADYRGSVANPPMARFCLEKAAQQGSPEAQRRLGALELREATEIDAMERAVALLHSAARLDDAIANTMLQSLVLPVSGSEQQAHAALDEVQRSAPLLAMRLRLARSFGLTKLEALSINPSSARRAWGLVTGKNPFVVKMRLSESRAVPALSQEALECLGRAAVMFGGDGRELAAVEGPLRVRALQQRRLFERLGLSDALFFANASSQQRDAIRVGTKWAQKQRQTLQIALAD